MSGQDLVVELRPLMPNLERARLDAKAWGLESGQIVWLLRLRRDSEGEEAIAPLALNDLKVEFAGDQRLHHPNSPEGLPDSGVYDPLQVLLAGRAESLTDARTRSMALIGPFPLDNPKCVLPGVEIPLVASTPGVGESPEDLPILDWTVAQKPSR
ncbi:MAG: hypothetical protein KDB61_04870 [Planctomycetes bacterium]|nr:hypothetical protein [Planctomycetota bacterium]